MVNILGMVIVLVMETADTECSFHYMQPESDLVSDFWQEKFSN